MSDPEEWVVAPVNVPFTLDFQVSRRVWSQERGEFYFQILSHRELRRSMENVVLTQLVKEMLDSSYSSDCASDTDSSSTDEESDASEAMELASIYAFFLAGKVRGECVPLPRIHGYLEDVVANYSEATFKSHFRMLPSTFGHILSLIGPSIEATAAVSGSGRKPLPAHKQLLLALWYMGTPDSYRSVCEKFDVGKATALRSLRRVTYALHCIASRFICWPRGNECERVKEGFLLKSGFPDVIGAIDGTHIEIDAPKDDARSYISRKDVYAVHLQAVCNDLGCFTHCYAGNAASVHDARVLKNSAIAEYMARGEEYFRNDCHLLGDGAYAIHPHMMVPFRNNGHLTPAQINFNFRLSQARQTIERAFGLLKARFRSLRDKLAMTTTEKVLEYIVACCVLHNVCLLQHDDLMEAVGGHEEEVIVPPPVEVANVEIRQLGVLKRQRIMENFII